MRVKVNGGTADHGAPSLRLTCRWATIIRGPRLSTDIIELSHLRSDSLRKRVEFVRSSELDDKDRFVLEN